MNNTNNTNMNMLLDLSALQLLPQILNELKDLKEMIELVKPNFTSSKDVMQILGIKSRQTLRNYIDNGTFEEGVHYKMENDKVIYIPEGIMEFKKGFAKGRKKVQTDDELEAILGRLAS